jgi:hypothetical protein
MAYDENIPQPTDKMNVSQNDILQNFTAIKTAWDINHVTFDLANEGKHNYVSLPEQSAGPATAANEGALYTKQSALTSVAALFFRRESSGTEIEFTSALEAETGWTRLPSGILLKWGNTTATGLATVTFPVAGTIPVFASIYTVLLTPLETVLTSDPDQAIIVGVQTTTNFQVYASRRTTLATETVQFEYLAIGI